jgi:hypothetical protein
MQSRGVADTYASLLTLLGRYSARPLARPPSPKGPRRLRLWASCCGTRRPSKEEEELKQRIMHLLHDDSGKEGEFKVGAMISCCSGGGKKRDSGLVLLLL